MSKKIKCRPDYAALYPGVDMPARLVETQNAPRADSPPCRTTVPPNPNRGKV